MAESAHHRSDGFRERGHQVTRLEAFVDAALAFAVTILVISVNSVPGSVAELVDALKTVPAFACTFALLAMFWHGHNVWSRRYGLDDGASVFLSLLLVFLVLVYVYPLRMIFGSFFSWLSWLLLPEAWRIPWAFRISSLQDIETIFAIYAVAWSSLGLVLTLLYQHAWRCRIALGLDLEERVATREEIAAWLMVPATGALSIAVGLVLPSQFAGMPGVVYGLMGFTVVVARRYGRHVRPAIEAEMARADSVAPKE